MDSNNNKLAFEQLFQDYKGRFVHFARTYVTDVMVAEDITVESFVYFWENRDNLKDESNIPAYILTIVKHKCLNYLNRMRMGDEIANYLIESDAWELNLKIATLEACNPEKLFSDEILKIVDDALKTLSKQTREIFERSRYHNQSYKEIANEMGISVKSVEFHITKALKVLRVALKDYYPLFLMLYKIYN